MPLVRDILTPEELAAIDLAAVALVKVAQAAGVFVVQLEAQALSLRCFVIVPCGYEGDADVLATGDVNPESTDPTPGEALANVEVP